MAHRKRRRHRGGATATGGHWRRHGALSYNFLDSGNNRVALATIGLACNASSSRITGTATVRHRAGDLAGE